MVGASKKDDAQFFGLTPREIELTIKAMITVLKAGGKPDFEALARITDYHDAKVANKNWNHVRAKLKAAESKIDGETIGNSKTGGEASGDKAGGKKRGKRQAVDACAEPVTKRARVRKNEDDGEEEESGAKAEADEDVGEA